MTTNPAPDFSSATAAPADTFRAICVVLAIPGIIAALLFVWVLT